MHFGSGRDAYFIVAMAVPVLEFALLFVIDFPCIVCYFFQEILVCKKCFFQKNPFPVTCTTVAYVCHITDIFIITEFIIIDIEDLYKYCKVTPAHQPIKVVLKTTVRSIEYSLSAEFHSMTYNYRIWGFFMIVYQTEKKYFLGSFGSSHLI